MNKLIENFDSNCYEAFINLLGIIGFLCGLLIYWVSFFWSIGCFIHLQIREGLVALLVCILSIIVWRGSEKLYNKLGIKED